MPPAEWRIALRPELRRYAVSGRNFRNYLARFLQEQTFIGESHFFR